MLDLALVLTAALGFGRSTIALPHAARPTLAAPTGAHDGPARRRAPVCRVFPPTAGGRLPPYHPMPRRRPEAVEPSQRSP